MHQVFLSLGTNIDQRYHNLRQALSVLSDIVTVTAVSAVYETAPWGMTDQPSFLNACLGGHSEHSPQPLLAAIKQLERTLGRTPTVKWGPRLIDIDILLYDQACIDDETLTIPHPFLHERAFVLIPLCDIAADVTHPRLGKTISALATAVDKDGIVRYEKPLAMPLGIAI